MHAVAATLKGLPAAPDHPLASHAAAVAVPRRHPDEGGDLAPGELSELRQAREKRQGGDLAHAGHAAPQGGLGLGEGTGRDGVLQVAIDVPEALLEPSDVLADVALDRPTGKAESVLLGREHVDAAG